MWSTLRPDNGENPTQISKPRMRRAWRYPKGSAELMLCLRGLQLPWQWVTSPTIVIVWGTSFSDLPTHHSCCPRFDHLQDLITCSMHWGGGGGGGGGPNDLETYACSVYWMAEVPNISFGCSDSMWHLLTHACTLYGLFCKKFLKCSVSLYSRFCVTTCSSFAWYELLQVTCTGRSKQGSPGTKATVTCTVYL